MTNEAVVIPLKRFDIAKNRLRRAPHLNATSIAQALAENVIVHSRPRHIIVLSESRSVSQFAKDQGVEVRSTHATSLNEAVQGAYDELTMRFNNLIIVHGDLRHPENLGHFDLEPGITFVADHRGEGTNVIVIPTGLDFQFSYGEDSLRRHVDQAARLGVDFRVVRDSPWCFDVDEPADLDVP
ncbi:MAG: hypothetical protein ACYCPT_06715 [Acidimicrobiales bacterium]